MSTNNNTYKYSAYNVDLKTKDVVFVYNTYTGCFCELTKDLYSKIYGKKNLTEDVEFFEQLLDQGIIVSANIDEYNRIIFDENYYLNSQDLDSVTDVCALTLNCNMKCVYCFEANNKNCKKKISPEVINAIIQYMKEQLSSPIVKHFMITWFGGEPLLEYDNILLIGKEMKAFCEQKNITFKSGMITNGLLLTEEKFDNLKNYCNLEKIQITLDGTKDFYCKLKQVPESVFYKVVNNICMACNKFNIVIRLNTNKENIDDLKNLISLLFETYNLKNKIRIYLAEIKDYSEKPSCSNFESTEFEKIKNEFFTELEKKYNCNFQDRIFKRLPKKTTCSYIRRNNAIFGPEGEIYKCEHNIGNPNCVVGNVFDGIYYNEEYKKYNTAYHYSKCKKCKMFPLCLSGCRNHQLLFNEKNVVDCKGIFNSMKLYLQNTCKKIQKEGKKYENNFK